MSNQIDTKFLQRVLSAENTLENLGNYDEEYIDTPVDPNDLRNFALILSDVEVDIQDSGSEIFVMLDDESLRENDVMLVLEEKEDELITEGVILEENFDEVVGDEFDDVVNEYGETLVDVAERRGFRKVLSYLRRHGVKSNGIYRKAENKSRVSSLKGSFQKKHLAQNKKMVKSSDDNRMLFDIDDLNTMLSFALSELSNGNDIDGVELYIEDNDYFDTEEEKLEYVYEKLSNGEKESFGTLYPDFQVEVIDYFKLYEWLKEEGVFEDYGYDIVPRTNQRKARQSRNSRRRVKSSRKMIKNSIWDDSLQLSFGIQFESEDSIRDYASSEGVSQEVLDSDEFWEQVMQGENELTVGIAKMFGYDTAYTNHDDFYTWLEMNFRTQDKLDKFVKSVNKLGSVLDVEYDDNRVDLYLYEINEPNVNLKGYQEYARVDRIHIIFHDVKKDYDTIKQIKGIDISNMVSSKKKVFNKCKVRQSHKSQVKRVVNSLIRAYSKLDLYSIERYSNTLINELISGGKIKDNITELEVEELLYDVIVKELNSRTDEYEKFTTEEENQMVDYFTSPKHVKKVYEIIKDKQSVVSQRIFNKRVSQSFRRVESLEKMTDIEFNKFKSGEYSKSFLDESLSVNVGKGDFEVVDKLIELGANINNKEFSNKTPIMFAIHYENLDMIKHLIDNHNADINMTDKNGKTALQWAKEIGNQEIVDYLISKGAK